MRGCDYIAKYFKEKGMTHYFGYQGGAVTPLIDSMALNGIDFIQSYHEQAGGFAADAYARISDKITLAVATNGPGATNFVSAIANAYLDSTPCLFLTGQVNTTDIRGKNIRQNGFQEVDTVDMVKPITKYAKTILSLNDIKYELDKAINIANSGRKGAVLLDFPLDILMSEVDENQLREYAPTETKQTDFKIDKILDVLKSAKRPLVLIGGGVRLASAENEVTTFLQKTGIPSVSSLMGKDVFTPTSIGLSGLYGYTYANLAVLNADVLLVLGSRLSKRQFGKELEGYAPNAQIIQIDIDENEIEHVVKSPLSITADLKDFLLKITDKVSVFQLDDWKNQIEKWQKQYKNDVYVNDGLDPVKCVEEISNLTPSNSIITTDVGQNQMWVAQGWNLKEGQRILTSGGLGCMGFSLPASVGASIAEPDKHILAFMGDGGLQMNIQELQTIVEHNLPVKVIVFNNQSLGMIAEMQHKYMDNRYIGTKKGYSCPNLEKIATAYGLKYIKYQDNWENILSLKEPILVEVVLESNPTRVLIKYDKSDIYQKEILNG